MNAAEASAIRQREVRLGIVLYGGVSLAIYENGVAQELFRAVQGEGVYTFIKYLIDSDVVVDIISGTSAGGINAILLGYALANRLDFGSSSRLWREDGDLLRLLSDPDKDATSLLDSRGYYQERLESAFDGMPAYLPPGNDGIAPGHRIVSQTDELDLFVTGTDIQGHTYTAFDDDGHPIDEPRSISLFFVFITLRMA
jgi:patatin-related protein